MTRLQTLLLSIMKNIDHLAFIILNTVLNILIDAFRNNYKGIDKVEFDMNE